MVNVQRYRGRRLFASVGAVAVALLVVAFLLVNGALGDAGQRDVQDQTTVGAVSAARAIGDVFVTGHDLALTTTGITNFDDVVERKASKRSASTVRDAVCNILQSNPRVMAFYLFGARGSYITGYDSARCVRNQEVPAAAVPGGWFARGSRLHAGLTSSLGGEPNYLLAFDRKDEAYGSLYHIHPVVYGAPAGAAAMPGKGMPAMGSAGGPAASEYHGAVLGALIERFDAASILGAYVQPGGTGNVILDGTIVVGPQIADYASRGELPVLSVDPRLDASITGDLRQTPVGFGLDGDHPHFNQAGIDEAGTSAGIVMSGLRILAYTNANSLSGSARGVILLTLLIVALASAGILALILYLNRQLRQGERESSSRIRARSELLTRDIVRVSAALSVVREGDLTVRIPASESEVGLLGIELNGLITGYSGIVGGIIRASQAVQDGALRVDHGVRRIAAVATTQTASIAGVVAGVEEAARRAVAVQGATGAAAAQAVAAEQAVEGGALAVDRIAEAVDTIKETAVEMVREFKRLQDDSVRLTALVVSVKLTAQSLDSQATHAAREARALGTESGAIFASSIGYLARQAQDTVLETEGAVERVMRSLDGMHRRIDRISEGVRRGVGEARAIRAAFAAISSTNGSLVRFIDDVAVSSTQQTDAAQQASSSMRAMVQVFEQFTDLLLTSGDELSHMRQVVAELQASVAGLRVGNVPAGQIGVGPAQPAERRFR